MISKKILNNVLRNIVAGKEDLAPTETSPETAPGAAPAEQNVSKPVQRWRYYFYDAPPENSIKFSYLSEILQRDTPERASLIEKLKGGNTGKFFSDYFRWKKVIIATTQYSSDGSTLVVYEADLNPMGTKVAGSERIYPEKANATKENFEADLILFSDKRGNSGVINIDNSGESLFSDQDPPSNIVNVLLNRTRPAGKFNNFNDFVKIFDEYRIWANNLNQLLLPNFDVPSNDDVQGGHYVGGQAAFNTVVGPTLNKIQQEKQPEQTSLKDKTEQQPSTNESPFQPVDEQGKGKVDGDYLDNPTGSPMAKKFSSKSYDLKRMTRRVLAGYMGEASLEEEASMGMSTSTGGGSSGDQGNISKSLIEESEQHTYAGKKLKTLADDLKRLGR